MWLYVYGVSRGSYETKAMFPPPHSYQQALHCPLPNQYQAVSPAGRLGPEDRSNGEETAPQQTESAASRFLLRN